MTAAALAAQGPFGWRFQAIDSEGLFALLASSELVGRSLAAGSWYWATSVRPYDHPESNYRMTREAMLAKAPCRRQTSIPCGRWYPEEAALRYEQTLKQLRRRGAGSGAALFDVTLLGLAPTVIPPRCCRANRCCRRKRWSQPYRMAGTEVRITMTFR